MKLAAFLAALFVICCTGCRTTRYKWENLEEEDKIRERMSADDTVQEKKETSWTFDPRARERGKFGIFDLMFGATVGAGNRVVDHVKGTRLMSGMLCGFALGVGIVENKSRSGSISLELQHRGAHMPLKGRSFDYGMLRVSTLALAFRFETLPTRKNRFTFHVSVSLPCSSSDEEYITTTYATASLNKSDEFLLKDLASGTVTKIKMDIARGVHIGVGVNYYIDPHMCFYLSYLYEDMDLPVKWTVDGVVPPEYQHIKNFDISCHKFITGIRFFF